MGGIASLILSNLPQSKGVQATPFARLPCQAALRSRGAFQATKQDFFDPVGVRRAAAGMADFRRGG
jgi:hypothetical protein